MRQHLQTSHRRNIDDASAGVASRCRAFGARQHALANLLRYEKRAFDVGVEDEIKVVLGHVLHTLGRAYARVIHQDIDAADFGFRMGDGRLDAVQIRHVQGHDMGVATFGLDFGAQLFEFLNAPTGQHHRSASTREGFGELLTQTAGRAGYQCYPS